MDMTKDAIELLLATGRTQNNIHENPGGDPYLVKPTGEAVNMGGFYSPRRIKQSPMFQDSGSFADYVNLFKTNESLIFALMTETNATLTAVLDYHRGTVSGVASPNWCQHRAMFAAQPTPEWQAWQAANRRPMNQVEFATWIEDNMNLFATGEIAAVHEAPSGAELLELVRTLHGHQNARFTSNLRLDNGAYCASYEEDHVVKGMSTVKAGSIELPKQILGGFPLFLGGVPYAVEARLKSRITDRVLMLHFETISPVQLVRENLLALVRQVGEKTGIVPLLGTL